MISFPMFTFSSNVRTELLPVTFTRTVIAASFSGTPPVNSLQLRFASSVNSRSSVSTVAVKP